MSFAGHSCRMDSSSSSSPPQLRQLPHQPQDPPEVHLLPCIIPLAVLLLCTSEAHLLFWGAGMALIAVDASKTGFCQSRLWVNPVGMVILWGVSWSLGGTRSVHLDGLEMLSCLGLADCNGGPGNENQSFWS